MPQDKLQAKLALGIRSRDLADQYASKLSARGFDIVRTAGRGVSFEGPPELFVETFQSQLNLEETPSFETNPELPEELRDNVDSVYFPTRPDYFGRR